MAPLDDGSVLLFVGVVAHQCHRAAVGGGAGEHRMAQRAAGPVEPWRLAVPDADDAVVAARVERDRQLRTHHRGGRELFVHARLEHHLQPVGDGQLGCCGHITVVPGQRAARIAGDVGGSGEPGAPIGPQLLVRQPGERLCATEEGATVVEAVSVG